MQGRRFASVDPELARPASSPTRHEATAQHVHDAIASAERARPPGRATRRRARRGALPRRRHPAPAALELAALAVREAASRGARPTPTSARRSTSSSTTRRARSRWRGPLAAAAARRAQRDRYVARGVTGVIAPWNFPLAIPAGMVGRRAGRPATPSSSSPPSRPRRCAKAVVDALHAGGVPPRRCTCCPAATRSAGARRRPARRTCRVHRLAAPSACRSSSAPRRSCPASATSSA